MKLHSLLTLFVLAAMAAGSQAAMYKWVDENGQTVYSQAPPPSGQSTRIKPPPPPAESPDEAQRRLNERLQKLDDAAEDRELAGQKKEKEQVVDPKRAEIYKANCSAARSNLLNLEGNPRKLVRKPNGEFVRLTEEERQQMIQEARGHIDKFCK